MERAAVFFPQRLIHHYCRCSVMGGKLDAASSHRVVLARNAPRQARSSGSTPSRQLPKASLDRGSLS